MCSSSWKLSKVIAPSQPRSFPLVATSTTYIFNRAAVSITSRSRMGDILESLLLFYSASSFFVAGFPFLQFTHHCNFLLSSSALLNPILCYLGVSLLPLRAQLLITHRCARGRRRGQVGVASLQEMLNRFFFSACQ